MILFDQDILIKFCPPRDSIKVRPSFTYLSIGGRDFMDTLRSFAETTENPKGESKGRSKNNNLTKRKGKAICGAKELFLEQSINNSVEGARKGTSSISL